METIGQTLLNNWHWMRWLRLGMGLFLAIIAYQTSDSLAGVIGALLFFQAVTNSGCGGKTCCTIPSFKGHQLENEEITISEVK